MFSRTHILNDLRNLGIGKEYNQWLFGVLMLRKLQRNIIKKVCIAHRVESMMLNAEA
jgi:hypothetical protein